MKPQVTGLAAATGKMFDTAFEEKCIERVTQAMQKALAKARKITHVGTGKAKVDKVASNRRVVLPDRRSGMDRAEKAARSREEWLFARILGTSL